MVERRRGRERAPARRARPADGRRHAPRQARRWSPSARRWPRPNTGDASEFLFARMYRHWRVNRMTTKARRVIGELFARCSPATRACSPTDWRARAGKPASDRPRRWCGDYIAGMTDRFALEEYAAPDRSVCAEMIVCSSNSTSECSRGAHRGIAGARRRSVPRLPEAVSARVEVSRTRDAAHGDMATQCRIGFEPRSARR